MCMSLSVQASLSDVGAGMDLSSLCIIGALVLWVIGELVEYFPGLNPKWKTISNSIEEYEAPKGSWLAAAGKLKPVLLLTNPVSGGGDGKTILERIIKPMMERAGVRMESVLTEHAGHAIELAKKLDLAEHSAIVVCGGDSTLSEVISGLASRVDLDETKLRALLAKAPPITLIPGGTSNGLSTSFGYREPFPAMKAVLDATEHKAVDLMQLKVDGKVAAYDIHVISWAIIADHDRLVEDKLRWMGPMLKTIVAPLFVIGRCRPYSARMGLFPKKGPKPDGYDEASSSLPKCEERGPFAGSHLIDSSCLLLSMCNTAWAQYDVCLAPGAKHDDGAVDVCLIRGQYGRFDLIRTFLGFSKASQLQQPWFETYKVEKVVLEPTPGHSFCTLDLSGRNCEAWSKTSKVAEVSSLAGAIRYLA